MSMISISGSSVLDAICQFSDHHAIISGQIWDAVPLPYPALPYVDFQHAIVCTIGSGNN